MLIPPHQRRQKNNEKNKLFKHVTNLKNHELHICHSRLDRESNKNAWVKISGFPLFTLRVTTRRRGAGMTIRNIAYHFANISRPAPIKTTAKNFCPKTGQFISSSKICGLFLASKTVRPSKKTYCTPCAALTKVALPKLMA